MIAATVDGVGCWLLTEDPDWGAGVTADFASATDRDAGLTARESRVRLASATVLSLAWRAKPEPTAAVTLEDQLAGYDNRPVLAPFWPGVCLLSECAASVWGDGLRVFFEPDWSEWQIRAGAQAPNSFAPTVDCLTAPLAWCRFAKLPVTQKATPLHHTVDLSVVETGAATYAVAPRPLVLSPGPIVGGVARPYLPVTPDWSSSPQQELEIRIQRKAMGNARGEAEEYYAHTPHRTLKLGFVGTAAEAASLIELFRQSGGMARPWWLPAGDLGAEQICRFQADKLTVKFAATESADVDFSAFTLPTEAADVLGFEGTSAALLVVTDGANTWLWTDHDAPVDAGTLGVFESRHFELGEFTEELNLETHDGSIEIRAWDGCPFLRLVEESESYELWVTAYECDPEVANSAEWLFTGRARLSKATGPFLSISLGGFESILETKGPRQLMQDTCCAAYGDAKCTKVLSALGVAAVSSTGAQLDLVLPDPAPTVASYAYGFAERSLGPGRVQRWTIRSGAIVGTVLRLQLDGAIHPAATAGQSWDLYTGCPGTWAACQERGNTVNFRGFPHVPTRNPSIVPVTTTTGGKK